MVNSVRKLAEFTKAAQDGVASDLRAPSKVRVPYPQCA